MTNAEIIATIRTETERLKNTDGVCQNNNETADIYYARGARFACEALLSFLSDLEKSEKPINQEGLKEEIHKYNKERFDEYFPEQEGDFISEVDFMTCLDRVARHFAQWGAEHLKK